MKLYVGVEVYQLIVTDAHVFKTWSEAEAWYREYTGVVWGSQDEPNEDFDQSNIFEVEVSL